MRYLTVKYKNDLEDIVPAPLLDQLIATDSIKQFYRPSEQRWIILGMDKTASCSHQNRDLALIIKNRGQ